MGNKALRQIIPIMMIVLMVGVIYSCGQKGTSTSTGTISGTVNMPATGMGLTSYNFNLLPLSQAGSAVSGATVRVADSEQET
ncbi:MAG: hypothetical protein M1491_00370, partial [Deltaproteobacteria bacterium]|nr:hypothetical protein [Deltaproteobacteria bacterium]MCL5277795.1 hypothetical protein [Deltaproteobacteria bacterium]